MSIDRSRRITFEEVADLYNETRTRYLDALIEDIMAASTNSRCRKASAWPRTQPRTAGLTPT